jgi:hypothetical protein
VLLSVEGVTCKATASLVPQGRVGQAWLHRSPCPPPPFSCFPEAGGPARALVPPSATVREGYLLKRKEEPAGLATRFDFKKRYFWLSGENLSYARSPEWQVRLLLQRTGSHP